MNQLACYTTFGELGYITILDDTDLIANQLWQVVQVRYENNKKFLAIIELGSCIFFNSTFRKQEKKTLGTFTS